MASGRAVTTCEPWSRPARAAIAGAQQRLLANAEKIADPIARARFLDGVPEHRRTLARARQWLAPGA